MIKILTDSCADLSLDLINEFDIGVIDLQVNINQTNYLDRELTQEQLFKYVEETGQLPKTSARSVNDFAEFFKPYDEMIYIGVGEKLSATFQSAILAAQELPDQKIILIDSKNLSTGIGLLVLKAAEMSKNGSPLTEIEESIRNKVSKIRTSFAIDTLEYLHKGGRCSGMTNIVGSLLKIRPIIEVKNDGTLGVKDKVRGSRKKAITAMIKDFQKNLVDIDPSRVFVTHTGSDLEANEIKEALAQYPDIQEIQITRAGSVISSHCGPDTYGIIYAVK